MLKAGSRVRLVVPENPRLDGSLAVVERVEEWGAHVLVEAAATGRFRAAHQEMVPYALVNGPRRARVQAKDQGYTGDACEVCGGMKMRRSGACLVCDDCGAAGGCG